MRRSKYQNPRLKMFFYLLFSIVVLAVVVLLSTRLNPHLKKTNLLNSPPTDIGKIEHYLEFNESKFNPKPGTEKRIFFNSAQKQKSKLSFVYLHGFSATRQEASPVFEKIASYWAAPIFMTRFFGHGLGPDDLGLAKQEHWIQDAIEAYQIGLSLGDEVILSCMSTGCALGFYLAYFFPEKIKAMILLSPNFAPADPKSFLALGPLGPITTRLVIGPYREFTAANSQQAYYWTCKYDSAVLPEMISLVAAVRNLDLEKIKVPVLTLYTPFDKVISSPEIEKNIPRLGSKINKLIPLVETQEHVIAGNIMNPVMNDKVIGEINSFLKGIIEK